jgi:ATP-dependent DNA helicase PIF1
VQIQLRKQMIKQEFFNSLTVNGLPPHKLILKSGTPIILLRNLQPNDDLCNGTRLVCRTFQKHDIETEIITGNHPGTRVFIPHMMSPSEQIYLSFSNVVAFAMTKTKSYGQTSNWVYIFQLLYFLEGNSMLPVQE